MIFMEISLGIEIYRLGNESKRQSFCQLTEREVCCMMKHHKLYDDENDKFNQVYGKTGFDR